MYLFVCTIQQKSSCTWIVKKRGGQEYIVEKITEGCELCKEDKNVCTLPHCNWLCYHMYACSQQCYSYTNGHICKHIHRVHSLMSSAKDMKCEDNSVNQQMDKSNLPMDITEEDPFSYAEAVVQPQQGIQ